MQSLERRALDTMISALLDKVGGHARILSPSQSFTALDETYVGVLKRLVLDAYPQTPEVLLHSLADDLIVVTRALDEAPSELVGYEPCTLRVTKKHANGLDELQQAYGDLLNVTILSTRYLETDLRNPSITFDESFFKARSISGWAKLSRHFARVCAAMEELKNETGLKLKDVFHDEGESHLVPTQFVDGHGDTLELTAA